MGVGACLLSREVETDTPVLNQGSRIQVRVKQVESQHGINVVGTDSKTIVGECCERKPRYLTNTLQDVRLHLRGHGEGHPKVIR